ncbi:MAG: hypothetical protein ACR2O0_08750 [Rhizobiaceae bacterium]
MAKKTIAAPEVHSTRLEWSTALVTIHVSPATMIVIAVATASAVRNFAAEYRNCAMTGTLIGMV